MKNDYLKYPLFLQENDNGIVLCFMDKYFPNHKVDRGRHTYFENIYNL